MVQEICGFVHTGQCIEPDIIVGDLREYPILTLKGPIPLCVVHYAWFLGMKKLFAQTGNTIRIRVVRRKVDLEKEMMKKLLKSMKPS